MATSLKEIRREMLARNQALGLKFNLASATTTTAVVTALAAGGFTQGRFFGRFLVRAEAATAAGADRVRRVTDFTASSGTLTHAGANYTDTTATSEILEILEYEPWLYDRAINLTLSRLKRRDRQIIPCRPGMTRYYLDQLSWIERPSDILEVKHCNSPVITNNRYMQKRNSYNSSGALIPDDWTIISGATGTGFSTTETWKGAYSFLLERDSTDAQLSQFFGTLPTGVSSDSLVGIDVTAVTVCWSDTASKILVTLDYSPSSTDPSSYHTGNSIWQELSISQAIEAGKFSDIGIVNNIDADAGNAYIGESYAFIGTTVTDQLRRDNYPETTLELEDYDFDQGNGTLALILPERPRGTQYVIYSKRGYPQLDETRLLAGTADADVIDAPVDIMAIGAIGRLYEMLAERETDNERKTHYEELTGFWEQKFRPLAQQHLGIKKREPGVDFLRPKTLASAPRRL